MSIIVTAATLAAIYAQGFRPESEIHLGAGYSRIKLSPYMAERLVNQQTPYLAPQA